MKTSYVATAAEAALRAGQIQRAHYGGDLSVEHKGAIDIVTQIDRACEDAILEILRRRFPDHDIVAEESGHERRGSRFVWYVDPLDGTTNYAHSYPVFASSIALVRDGVVIAAAVYDPMRQELFTAERGAGSRLNGAPIRTTQESQLISSLLITGFPYDIHTKTAQRLRLFHRFLGEARGVRRDGSAALDLCYVAAGRADGFWEERLSPWDFLAGILILEEAGGKTTRFDGSPLPCAADEILSTNGALHPAMIEVLRQEAEKGPG
jgi:myo-inositol-1(or 4)-monophosphatase